MIRQNEKTALNVSAATDTEQSLTNGNNIIPHMNADFNRFEEFSSEKLCSPAMSRFEAITMCEIYDTVYGCKLPIIDGFLYPGTYVFAGAPKIGKSLFMSQLAYHVATGIPLWDYAVRQGTVLYLALEDDYRRLQGRLYRMFGTESTANLYFSISASRIGKGFEEQLRTFVHDHPDTNLIIVDTLQKVRESGGESYSYSGDYDVITAIKRFTDDSGICVLLVHHTRKQSADDKFDMISGTTGLLGAADGAFLLRKDVRAESNAILEMSGRDQPDQKLHLVRNQETLFWELEKAEVDLWKAPPEPLLEIVAEFVNNGNTKWYGTPTELAESLGIDMQPNTMSKSLNVNAGRLLNEYGIFYNNKRGHEGRRIRLQLVGK